MLVTGWGLAAVAAALFAGAVLQRCIGFGMIVLAFPVLAVVEPALVPRATLVAGTGIVFYNAWINRGDVPWGEIGWLVAGRIPGWVLGTWLLTQLPPRTIALAGGAVVILSIAVSYLAPSLPRTPATLAGVGTVSSLFGITLSIGGPYLGLLYQHETGDRVRTILSFMMLTAAPVNLAILGATGNLPAEHLRTGLVLAPVAMAGVVLGGFVVPWVDDRIRPLILGVCILATVAAMARLATG